MRSWIVLLLVLFSLISDVNAATFVVTKLLDTDDGSCTTSDCSLREAITTANSVTGDDVITFQAGLRGTIVINSALPRFSSNIVLNGPGATVFTIARNSAANTPSFSILSVDAGTNVSLSGLTFTNGGGTEFVAGGGAVYNEGDLTITGCVFSDNNLSNYGGAIYHYSTSPLTIKNCTFIGNTAVGGGAISNTGSVLHISNSTFEDNSTTSQYGSGGAIYNAGNGQITGTALINGCTFKGNSTKYNGGAINNVELGSLTVTNSTFSGNSADFNGGALYIYRATMAISNCTITGNRADALSNGFGTGGGIALDNLQTSTLNNSIVAGNFTGSNSDDINGSTGSTFASASNNLIGNAATSGGLVNGTNGNIVGNNGSGTRSIGTILNTTLSNNGGSTKTHALVTGSPALNAGSNSLIPVDALDADADANTGETAPYDQRGAGFVRVYNGTVDIGAVETQPIPSLSINDASITEGNSGTKNLTFTVTLSTASTQTITVSYATANGTAKQPADYATKSGTLTFIPGGPLSQTVNVVIQGDTVDEVNETLFLILSSPSNAVISRGRGVGTITDDDPTPAIAIDDVSIGEGNSGQRIAAFRLRLSAVSGRLVQVTAATANGTATSGSDYVVLAPTQISFNVGSLYAYARVLINGDALNETNETFFVNLSNPVGATLAGAPSGSNQALGTILNDDRAPAITVNDVSVVEGNSGTKQLTFTVALSAPSGQNVQVNFATADGIARSTSDYVARSSVFTITAGQVSRAVAVIINGDTQIEANETLYLLLSNAVNATIGRGRGIGTITNDDTSG